MYIRPYLSKIVQALLLVVVSMAFLVRPARAQTGSQNELGTLYGGIEVGSKGVKATAIRATESIASGATRIAAPVGQARTQAGPPSIPVHMSHLIAFFGAGAAVPAACLRQALSGSPGPGPPR